MYISKNDNEQNSINENLENKYFHEKENFDIENNKKNNFIFGIKKNFENRNNSPDFDEGDQYNYNNRYENNINIKDDEEVEDKRHIDRLSNLKEKNLNNFKTKSKENANNKNIKLEIEESLENENNPNNIKYPSENNYQNSNRIKNEIKENLFFNKTTKQNFPGKLNLKTNKYNEENSAIEKDHNHSHSDSLPVNIFFKFLQIAPDYVGENVYDENCLDNIEFYDGSKKSKIDFQREAKTKRPPTRYGNREDQVLWENSHKRGNLNNKIEEKFNNKNFFSDEDQDYENNNINKNKNFKEKNNKKIYNNFLKKEEEEIQQYNNVNSAKNLKNENLKSDNSRNEKQEIKNLQKNNSKKNLVIQSYLQKNDFEFYEKTDTKNSNHNNYNSNNINEDNHSNNIAHSFSSGENSSENELNARNNYRHKTLQTTNDEINMPNSEFRKTLRMNLTKNHNKIFANLKKVYMNNNPGNNAINKQKKHRNSVDTGEKLNKNFNTNLKEENEENYEDINKGKKNKGNLSNVDDFLSERNNSKNNKLKNNSHFINTNLTESKYLGKLFLSINKIIYSWILE